MSQETNNEIDLLLRRMGRRDNSIARDSAASGEDSHLDTDELSSYAQNALPAAARARYTAHLAECATCRRLVTELSLSLGAATAPARAAHEPSGLKKFLAGLFSPLVLRYAVPALGVIVVMVIGFVVLRQQSQHELTAQLQERNGALPAAAPSAETTPSHGFTDQPAREIDKLESNNAKPSETKRKTESTPGEAGSGAGAAAPAPAAKDNGPVAEVKPVVTATPAPAAPAKAAEATEPQAKTDAVAKKQEEQSNEKPADEAAKAPSPAATTSGLYQNQPAEHKVQNAPKLGSSTGALAGSRPISEPRGIASTKRTETKEQEKGDDANRVESRNANIETRTIAGRRFRKQGGVWTDTAYDSSTATVNMTRNSEQFRALVADEPAIGTIAGQLEGEVIVIWKGRAYHIR